MANPFLVLGGVAVGIVVAAAGVLTVPGWIASAQDASAINDLANIANAQAIYRSTKGVFSNDIVVLSGGSTVADGFSTLRGAGGHGGVTSAAAAAPVKSGDQDPSFHLSNGVTLSLLATNPTGDAFCAVVQSPSGRYFASSELKPKSDGSTDIQTVLDNAECQPEARGEFATPVAQSGEIVFSYLADTTACQNVSLNLNSSGRDLDATIDWGDGTTSAAVAGDSRHAYETVGDYKITVTGVVPAINKMPAANAPCLTGVTKWDEGLGTVSAREMFRGTSERLTQIAPLPSTVTDISGMFNRSSFTADITGWNTTNVTNMSGLFLEDRTFNSDIGSWNTSNVTDMSSMFLNAVKFNQDIGDWDTSRVTNMSSLFTGATVYNYGIGKWDVSSVKRMDQMFTRAVAFNKDISQWNVANVTNMSYMFNGATSFNQPIDGWTTSKVSNMSMMFANAVAFNQPIGAWNTSAVTNFAYMFQNANSFNQPIGNWDTSEAVDVSLMFSGATRFNQPIGTWDTSKVEKMRLMFNGAAAFNQDINAWETSHVTDMYSMFYGAASFNRSLSNWDTSKVMNMYAMFQNATSFNQPIGAWNTGSVTDMSYMFYGASKFSQGISSWDVANVTTWNWFKDGSGLTGTQLPAKLR